MNQESLEKALEEWRERYFSVDQRLDCVNDALDDLVRIVQAHADSGREVSESLWASALDMVPDAIFIHDENDRVILANRAYLERANVSPEQLRDYPYFELFPRTGEPLSGCIDAVRHPGREQFSTELSLADGAVFLHRGFAVRNEQHRFAYGIHLLQDVTELRRIERHLANSNELLERLFENVHMLVAHLDREFNILRVNQAYAAADGRDPDFFPGKNLFELYPSEEHERIFRTVVETGEPFHIHGKRFVHPEQPQRVTYWDWSALPVKEAGGEVSGLMLLLRDVTEGRMAELTRDRLSAILEATPDVVTLVDENERVIFLNAAGRRLFGREAGALNATDVLAEWHAVLPRSRKAEVSGCVWSGESALRSGDGRYVPVSVIVLAHPGNDDEPGYYSLVARDIRERKRFEAQLEFRSQYDELTGLPNRSLMQDRLAQTLAYANRYDRTVALLFINVNNFALVNEIFGHTKGDEALRIIGERMRATSRRGDTVARYGGDEFVIILADVEEPDDARSAAERYLEAISAPLALGEEIRLSAGAGIAMFPRDGADASTLLKHALAASLMAQQQGINGVSFYHVEMNAQAAERLAIESRLRYAIEHDELVLHYQPRVELASGRIVGFEALVRWQHPERGLIPPMRFIPIAEANGLIVPLGEWVLRRACATVANWQAKGLSRIVMSVNLSARQLRQRDLENCVNAAFNRAGIDPQCLELELTESELMDDPDDTLKRMRALKAMGIRLAMDDFGTGYSSLAYVQRFPFDILKIDRSFVAHMTEEPNDATLVRTILAMARSLGLRVVAEGVETEAQLAYLRRHSCEEVQGYFLSPPLDELAAERFLRANETLSMPVTASRPTVLVVDDNPIITEALEYLLRSDGYSVLAVNDPVRAFDLLATNDVQVVISDQCMPTMTGTEFLSRVKELYPHTVRLALTGFAEIKTVTELVNRGWVYKLLYKPLDETQLREAVREAFAHYERFSHRGVGESEQAAAVS